MTTASRDGTLVGYIFSKRYKKVSPHRKSHNLLYNLLKEKNKPPQEMVNKRGVPFGPTWLTRTLETVRSIPRIIYIRFHTKLAVLLHRIRNHNTKAESKTLIVETFGHLQGKTKGFYRWCHQVKAPSF